MIWRDRPPRLDEIHRRELRLFLGVMALILFVAVALSLP